LTDAAYLGRFQPFHLGHRNVIEEERENFDSFVIVIGSADKGRTEDNPLTFEERKELVKSCFPEIEIVELEDAESKQEEDNQEWCQRLEEKLDIDVMISQNDLVKRIVDEYTDFEVHGQQLHEPDIYSGTEVRRRIRSGEEWRYLIPNCCQERMEELTEAVKKSGTQYEFEPGWKKENAFHGKDDG